MSTLESLHFAGRFLRNPGRVGAIAPSSKFLSRAMIQGIDLQPSESLIEFGPGTGSVTAAIREMLPQPSQYLGIERDDKFHTMLCKRFPDLRFVHGSAEHAETYIESHQLPKLRAIISGLPFASFPHSLQESLIQALDRLMTPGVEFRTFAYLHAYQLPAAVRFRRIMKPRFGEPQRSRLVFRNLPPAYVLTWRR